MKDQILAKIKSIIQSNANMPTEDLERIVSEIDVIVGFFETEVREKTLAKLFAEMNKTKDYLESIINNIKEEEDEELERSKNEADKDTKSKD